MQTWSPSSASFSCFFFFFFLNRRQSDAAQAVSKHGSCGEALPASACLTNMLIRVQIFTHLISRGLGCFILIGGGKRKEKGRKRILLFNAWI